MEIYNLESPAFCEAMGLSNVFKAYAEECIREEIQEVGFNANSGYVYIALENGISICSCMGQRIEFLVFNFETGEELFFDNYTQAENRLTDED
jgi:hypothetical protein